MGSSPIPAKVDTKRIKADGQHLITSERMGLKPAGARIAQIGSEVARCKATWLSEEGDADRRVH